MKPRLLDLCSGAGGAARGYQRAGFYVVGVDVRPQPRYAGDEFHQADALTFDLSGFDAIHASPPCQRWTSGARRWRTDGGHPDLIAPVRERLLASGLPFVLENVPAAPLRCDLTLCGSMFGLRLIRHRVFEVHGFAVSQPEHGEHHPQAVTVTGHTGGTSLRDGGQRFGRLADRVQAMGIDWMTNAELVESIPPAYTEWVGAQLLASVR